MNQLKRLLERRKRKRNQMSALVLTVGLSGFGVYTGFRRKCATFDAGLESLIAGVNLGMNIDASKNGVPRKSPSKKDKQVMALYIQLLDISHEIGHLLRDSVDKSDLQHVMTGFKSAMTSKSDR